MPSDNPFSEPHDSERTMFIPSPGGVRAPAAVAARTEPAAAIASAAPAQGPANIDTGNGPLLAAAASLLALLARLRNTAHAPDAGDLRARAVSELRRFEQRAREDGIGMEQLRPAHYALCASLDDVVLATPWGAEGAWATRSLVSTFHEQVRSGEGFFSLLRQMTQSPSANPAVLELMYFCLSLGFQGQYRLSPRGPAELDRVREDLYGLIRQHRTSAEPALSPNWQGVAAPYRPRRTELPLWVAAVAALAMLGALFVLLLIQVSAISDPVLRQINTASPESMPAIARAQALGQPTPAPPELPVCERLRTTLAPLRQVSFDCKQSEPVLRVSGDGMFASASASIAPPYLAALDGVGAALKSLPGDVIVAGYTDSQPMRRSLRFPSNVALSQARAEAAVQELATTIGDAARLTPEGRGDADLIEPDPAHQERNRRIEITLHQKDE